RVFEAALKICPGKCILNSINFEEGEERLKRFLPIIKRYGAGVIVGVIDENKGMAVSRKEKLRIAQKLHGFLVKKYKMPEEDIIFDALVFPAGTGSREYMGSARETIEGIRLIKARFPKCRTILGISNVSFGLPAAGREVMHAVFLKHCVSAGLDLAIAKVAGLPAFSSIPAAEVKLAERLLFWKGPGDPKCPKDYDAIVEFSSHFRSKKLPAKIISERTRLTPQERIIKYVVEGSKQGLSEDLDILLEKMKPIEIINGPLMDAMAEVERLFTGNELIIAEILGSAGVMKAAMEHLAPRMHSAAASTKAKIMIATVKGDVHDIGKNLVHIIFKNNGYEVVDLGNKVTPEALIAAIREHKPDLVGLSGLLVKSVQQMVVTAKACREQGIDVPFLVGGAALSINFTAKEIAPAYQAPVFYAKDAMAGLRLVNQYVGPGSREALVEQNRQSQADVRAKDTCKPKADPVLKKIQRARIYHDAPVPVPPDIESHLVEAYDLKTIFAYIDPIMLYCRQLGLRGNPERLFGLREPQALKLQRTVQEIQEEVIEKQLIKPKAIYKFFPVAGQENKILIFKDPKDSNPVEVFDFPRQADGEELCLSDYVRSLESEKRDFFAMFAVTCGHGITELSCGYREKGEYMRSQVIQALAIESAEALTELLHEELRKMWGFPDPQDLNLRQKFQAKYRGIRVSFGYPTCPNIEDQAKLFKLLDLEKHISLKLTDSYMMEPEASVSAIVFHHPQAKYFSI
ncbi:vitamin B12 dependent-methionine synthase activation domain-containing protein, partial [Elusimicrobiota bacterium]